MKLSMKWLADYTDVSDIDIKAYCDRMTDTGSKVEGYDVLAEDIENVVVGKIVSITKHENSDHLQICQLDCGEEELRQIVTGAQNVFEGAVVPVAKAPAKLPGGVTIKAGKLRGVASNGMLCSIAELGLTTHDMPGAIEDGILILNDVGMADAEIGADIRDVLMLKDTVVEFEITSNRPDCLSMIGLARESAVSFDRAWTLPTPKKPTTMNDGDSIDRYLNVEIREPELCYRYSARVVKNVKIAPSPLWLRMRLRAAGVPMPEMLAVDRANERILKQYIPGETVDRLILRDTLPDWCIPQMEALCQHLYAAGLNIDYFPTNLIPLDGTLYYVDYECNAYMSEWDFAHWGAQYWSKTPAFLAHFQPD